MNTQEIDAKLDHIALKCAVWKNQKLLAACLHIALHALREPVFWPDSLIFDFLGEADSNLIGMSWRICTRTLCLIEKTGQFRRSKGENANGRTIFQYKLISKPLAQAFVKWYDYKRYQELAQPQLSLGL